MENSSTPHTPAIIEALPANKNNSSHQMKAEVTMALSALDGLYKENISSYANEIHAYTQNIEKLQSRLAMLLKEQEPHLDTLDTHQKDIDYTLRLLERLTEEWMQKSIVIQALENELGQLEHSAEEREQILKNRNESLKTLAFEIEVAELLLLEHELQKQNIVLYMEPIEREVKTLEQSIKDLESEKRYSESAYLHQLSPSSASSQHALQHTSNTHIDTTTVINTES